MQGILPSISLFKIYKEGCVSLIYDIIAKQLFRFQIQHYSCVEKARLRANLRAKLPTAKTKYASENIPSPGMTKDKMNITNLHTNYFFKTLMISLLCHKSSKEATIASAVRHQRRIPGGLHGSSATKHEG